MAAIPAMLECGIKIRSFKPDAKGISRHVFAAKLRIGGKIFVVGLVVREDRNGRKFYDHKLSAIGSLDTATPESGGASAEVEVGQPGPHQGALLNIVRAKLGGKPKIAFSTDFMPHDYLRRTRLGSHRVAKLPKENCL